MLNLLQKEVIGLVGREWPFGGRRHRPPLVLGKPGVFSVSGRRSGSRIVLRNAKGLRGALRAPP